MNEAMDNLQEVKKLLEGTGSILERITGVVEKMITMSDTKAPMLKCSFCDKSQEEVTKLIVGPNRETVICNECIGLCAEIIEEDGYGLCYVDNDGGTAYFAKDIHQSRNHLCWHCAPYHRSASSPTVEDEVLCISFCAHNLYTPAMLFNHDGMEITVDQINNGVVPWLSSIQGKNKIWAGTSMQEFRDLIMEFGGTIEVYENED